MAFPTSRQIVNVLQPLVAAQFRSWATRVGSEHPAVAAQLNQYANTAENFDAASDELVATIGDWFANIEAIVQQYEAASEVTWASYVQAIQENDVVSNRLERNLTATQLRWYRIALGQVRGTEDEADPDERPKRAIKRIITVVQLVEAFVLYLEDGNPLPVLP